jgi:molybdopterin-containing oxidoreductase family iron-sulfur binding subunit
MSKRHSTNHRSFETMRLLKEAALPTHVENFALPDGFTRRGMLQALMGASAALALGAGGCERKPKRKIVSRVVGPEYQKPGMPLYYSSTWMEGSCPYGLVVKTVDGRPIKIEGNPEHPVNQGASSPAMQASLLSLYDPDRLRSPRRGGQSVTWAEADEQIVAAIRDASSVVLITRASLGPSERAIIDEFRRASTHPPAVPPGRGDEHRRGHPNTHHFVHETAHDNPRRAAWKKVYGVDGEVLPRFDRAKVIVSLDSDFLGTDGAVLENIRTFTQGRMLDDAAHGQAEISRLYVLESTMTLTGSNADHRIRLRPSLMGAVAKALRQVVRRPQGDDATSDEMARRASQAAKWDRRLRELATQHNLDQAILEALARDLRAARGEALVVAGPHLPESVHADVALLNADLGSPERTLAWNPLPATLPVTDPAEVEAVLEQGVDVVICLGVNPVYDWPGRDFKALLGKAGLSIGHGLYHDETLWACSLSLPSNHNLESWNDAEPRDGLKTLCQPVIAPLFDTRQEAESLFAWTRALSGPNDDIRRLEDWHDYLQRRWQRRLVAVAPTSRRSDTGETPVPQLGAGREETQRLQCKRAWEDALRSGGQLQVKATLFPTLHRRAAEAIAQTTHPRGGDYELVIFPHPAVYDGRFANNGWLQELPDPVSKLVWENVASMSPRTAEKLGATEGDMVALSVGNGSIELPVLIQPGASDGVVATTLGHGHTQGGRVSLEAGGTNVAPLLGQSDPAAPRLAIDVKVRKTGGSRKPVRTQKQFSMHGRPIVLDGTLDEYRSDAAFVKHKRHLPAPADLNEPYDYSKGHKWAMAVDLGACVGCNACVTACQAENNIPIVGRQECKVGREMHWIRIDRYHEGDQDNPRIHHQPMLCQHCDNAPCESVCPVNATSHSPEGLNEMTYNRCVGTRYCSNNCPYKVRRFNFLRYQAMRLHDPVQELAFNPQVTVRGVGVMEKCTFCVQRIYEAKFKVLNKGGRLADGAIQTACQQACPAQAIVFGDANDPNSRLAKLRSSPRAFHVLEELNVKPNVTYLARVRNPNPDGPLDSDVRTGSHEA